MAGLGRRTFAAGEVLTASNVMGYLQDQAVMTFAGTAARGSAIGTAVSEGMVSYLADTNDLQVYTGSVWQSLGPTNKILQVVATTYSTETTNNTTTFAATGQTATITPTSTSSKIIAMYLLNGVGKLPYNTESGAIIEFRRYIGGSGTLLGYSTEVAYTSSGTWNLGFTIAHTYVDSPNTTSAVTYNSWFRDRVSGNGVAVQRQSNTSQMVLIEVAG